MSTLQDRATEALVTRARHGCRESFGLLAEQHAKGVYNFLLRCSPSREDAEDLCQESFLRAWRKLDTYREDWRFSTWVYAIARSLASERARATRLSTTSAELAEHASTEDHARELDQRDEDRNLWDISRAVLDADQHLALWLFYAEERSAAEIGAILGRTPLAVRLLLFRARSSLGRHLERRQAARDGRPAPALRTRMESTT